jgi:HAD superfamily hydrolase (TIGR01509 family)
VGRQNLDAVLFDMDGTIIDSEPYWMLAEQELVARFGATWSKDQAFALVGSGLMNSAHMLQSAGVDMPAQDIVDFLSTRVLEQVAESIPWRPGVRELITELVNAQIPLALVTMSLRKNAEALAEALEQEIGAQVFTAIVSANDVENPKPDPEAYLRAASLLGVDIHRTIALEDSGFGAASAFSAGAITIGIPLHVPIAHHTVHVLWDSLEGKTVADLDQLFQAHTTQAQ